MARNYARHGMHFLSPELETAGRPRRAGTEFPIYSYLVALLFSCLERGRFWKTVERPVRSMGSGVLVSVCRERLGETRGLISGLVLCVIPIHIYFTRTVQPEPMALWGFLGFSLLF